MNRIRWFALLLICLSAGGSLAASSNFGVGAQGPSLHQGELSIPLEGVTVGRTRIRSTEPLVLGLPWKAASTSSEPAFIDITWMLNGQVVSESAEMAISLPKPGDYAVVLRYSDLQGNRYTAVVNVQVMAPEEYDTMMAAVRAAVNLPLWLEDEELFLPFVVKPGRVRQLVPPYGRR